MPEQFATTVKTAELRKGDSTGAGIVTSTDVKTKWTTVYFENGHKVRIENDGEWAVTRSQPTQAEKDATRRDFEIYQLRRNREASRKHVADAKAKMVTYLDSDYSVDHWTVENLLSAQATEELWLGVDQILKYHFFVRGYTIVEAVEAQRARCRESLLNVRPTSRSTSVISNAVDDVKLEAKAAFIRNW
jgi:hypothetical protein